MNRPDAASSKPWQPAQARPLFDHLDAVYVDGSGDGAAGEILAALRTRTFALLAWTAVCVALAGVYVYRAAPEYVATAEIVLEPRLPSAAMSEAAASAAYPPSLDSAQADSQVQVLKSERTLRFVFDTLDLADDPSFAPPPPSLLAGLLARYRGDPEAGLPQAERERRARERAFEAFSNRVGVRRIALSYAMELSYRARSPERAAKLANAIAASYILQQVKFKAASEPGRAQYLQGRIADIQAEEDAALRAVRTGTIPDLVFGDADARIVSSAIPPLGKAYPQSTLILLLATLVGLITGVAAVITRHKLDRVVRSRQRLARALGVSAIHLLPRCSGRSGLTSPRSRLGFQTALGEPDADFVEALRILRTVILSANRTPHRLAIGVVSYSPREGRSTVASNLAFVMSASREKVSLVDADFRNPALTQALAAEAPVGLDEILLAHAAGSEFGLKLAPSLEFVPAVGAGKTGSSDVFIGSADMHQFLRERRDDRDIVVDLPAMSVSSDAQAIGHLLDGVILIVEAGRTTLDEVREARDALNAAHVRVLSVVLNKAPAQRRRPKP